MMMSISQAIRRPIVASKFASMITQRTLSTEGQRAVEKFQQVMHEYRMENYTQETPYRFRQEVLSAARGNKRRMSGVVGMEGLQQVLQNIGKADQLSTEDLQLMFREVGDVSNPLEIPTNDMAKLLQVV